MSLWSRGISRTTPIAVVALFLASACGDGTTEPETGGNGPGDGGGSDNQPPQVEIVVPDPGETYAVGELVTFEASATDADGSIVEITWRSSRDGTIGEGASLSYEGLSVGSHTITVEATDDAGDTGSDALTLEVRAPEPVEGILFLTVRSSGSGQALYVMDPDGSNMREVAPPSAYRDVVPSPDGSRLAYINYVVDTFQLLVMNMDGTGKQQLTTGSTDLRSVSWSPDGSELVFTRGAGIEIMSANGGAAQSLTTNGQHNYVSWSPDGTRIAFSSSSDGIHILNLGTGEIEQITEESDYYAVWSPDGSRIAFSRFDVATAERHALFVMNPDGSGQAQLGTARFNLRSPTWSPNGDRIAFSWVLQRDGNGFQVISSVAPDGSFFSTLTDDGSELGDWNPNWIP